MRYLIPIFLQKVVDITIDQKPDAVFITGDLFDGRINLSEENLSPVKQIKVPVFFVEGNHDGYADEHGIDLYLSGHTHAGQISPIILHSFLCTIFPIFALIFQYSLFEAFIVKKILLYAVLVFLISLLFYCNPERNYIDDHDARLSFTVDTVYFDTVFTTIGTITRSFRVHNHHDRFIKIDKIVLAGGDNSVFRINVDGLGGTEFDGYEIAPNDSMYIFVEATLDLNNTADILRIQDSITFEVNGNLQDVDLVAWGQDVHLLRDSILDYSTTWIADKPYLIIGAILVDTLQTLTMEEGVKVYMHRDSWIYVKGSLKMAGSYENPVTVQGDRLELYYDEYPGQWGGIYFVPGSVENEIDNALIINGTVGFWADSMVNFSEPVLKISNTEINRMSHDGILARGSSIDAYNLVIGDCGNSCLELLYEGSYTFNHCTFANYWFSGFSNRRTPALFIANYFAYKDDNGIEHIEARDIEEATFRNCIIYGSNAHEIIVSKSPDGILNYTFDRCLTKMDENKYNFHQDPNFIAITNEKDPLFDSLHVSYELDTLSPAIDIAYFDYSISFPLDKKGDNRFADGKPDLGAFERIEQ